MAGRGPQIREWHPARLCVLEIEGLVRNSLADEQPAEPEHYRFSSANSPVVLLAYASSPARTQVPAEEASSLLWPDLSRVDESLNRGRRLVRSETTLRRQQRLR